MKAFLLCAGKGERLKPITDKIPKPLVKVDGVPIVSHQIAQLQDHIDNGLSAAGGSLFF